MKILMFSAAALSGLATAESLPLIPLPAAVRVLDGAFEFSAATAIRFERGLQAEAELLAAYPDYYQAPAAAELAKGREYECIGGLLPLEKVYSYNPAFIAENPAQEKQILGTQGQVWTEYIQDMKKAEYMAFPRIAALAEVAWTPLALKNYDDFRSRLAGVMKHYDGGHLNYARPPAAGPGAGR